MHFIVYVSNYRGRDIKKDLAEIYKFAKTKNPKNGITGLLFSHKHSFMQAIEGEKADLESLMSKIEADNRHSRITRIIDAPVAKRSYEDWNMDSFHLDDNGELCRDLINYFKQDYESMLTDVKPRIFIDCLKAFLLDSNGAKPWR